MRNLSLDWAWEAEEAGQVVRPNLQEVVEGEQEVEEHPIQLAA